MIGSSTVLGLVPARGGSKGIARKNLRPLAGKPLLQWTAEAAAASRYTDRLVLSSEDDEILALGQRLGLEPLRRPPDLATGRARAVDVALHALDAVGESFDYLVYLQPTSPLRTAEDIDACVELLEGDPSGSCVSVRLASEHPEWMFTLDAAGRLRSVAAGEAPPRRQDIAVRYVLNGAVYAVPVPRLRAERSLLTDPALGYLMPGERSVDIDEPIDWVIAEALLAAASA